jgi:hypothetical protein
MQFWNNNQINKCKKHFLMGIITIYSNRIILKIKSNQFIQIQLLLIYQEGLILKEALEENLKTKHSFLTIFRIKI